MQRMTGALIVGYARRRVALRKRRDAGPQPSRPATTRGHVSYRVRMRNASELPATWAQYVTQLRQAAGMSRPALAVRLGVDPTTVWRWETGRQRPESPDAPEMLAELFHLDLDEVLQAAGLKPSAAPPVEPTRERDEELEEILMSDMPLSVKEDLIKVLEEERARDRDRRGEHLRRMMDAYRRGR